MLFKHGYITLSKQGNELSIDRIFVYELHRGKGESLKMLRQLCDFADHNGIVLGAMICPDRDGLNEEQYNKVTDALYNSFKLCGFESLEFDGEVYRLDLSRQPKLLS